MRGNRRLPQDSTVAPVARVGGTAKEGGVREGWRGVGGAKVRTEEEATLKM